MPNAALALTGLLAVFITLTFSAPSRATDRPKTALDADAISQELGKDGEMKGDVYKISFPRTDLTVMVENLKVNPGLALGTWMAFKPAGDQTAAHGDLVLTEQEVGPVVTELERQGFQITGLHNHLLKDSPHVMYLHFWGTGDARSLARGLKHALRLTKTPIVPATGAASAEPFPEADAILKILGQKGEVQKGVLKVNIPRRDTIKANGTEVPPSMGMATALNFQEAGPGQVAATGDFVLTGEEVNRVARALTERGITITALHNHLLHASPDLYFMHFWAKDTPEKVAQGLKAALAEMQLKTP
jgi:hypothetical protein